MNTITLPKSPTNQPFRSNSDPSELHFSPALLLPSRTEEVSPVHTSSNRAESCIEQNSQSLLYLREECRESELRWARTPKIVKPTNKPMNDELNVDVPIQCLSYPDGHAVSNLLLCRCLFSIFEQNQMCSRG